MGHGNNKNNEVRIKPINNSRSMGRDGFKYIRDIAFGNFNIYKDGHIFRNLDFVKATLAENDKRMKDASIHLESLKYTYTTNPYYGTNKEAQAEILRLMHKDEKTVTAYMLIRNSLYAILQTNGDIGYLYVLASNLPNYKYYI